MNPLERSLCNVLKLLQASGTDSTSKFYETWEVIQRDGLYYKLCNGAKILVTSICLIAPVPAPAPALVLEQGNSVLLGLTPDKVWEGRGQRPSALRQWHPLPVHTLRQPGKLG